MSIFIYLLQVQHKQSCYRRIVLLGMEAKTDKNISSQNYKTILPTITLTEEKYSV